MSLSLGSCRLLCLFIAIAGVVVRGQVAGPNAVALINGQTMLDCLTSNLATSNWQHTPDGNSYVVTIASGCSVTGNNAAYYRAEQPGGSICRLIIANATMQQAGVYNCYNGATTVYRSLVTVIDPVASVVVYNQSDDKLNISCSISYNGPSSPAPLMRPSPYWTTSSGQIFTSATYHPSTNVVTLIGTVTARNNTVPFFQCNTVFEITGNTNGYNATPPADSFTVGNTEEQDGQSWQTSTEPSMVSASTATIATTNPYERTGTILQPEILDRSNGTPAPATYEELTRPAELDLLPITYAKLTPKPPIYANHLS